MKTPSADPEQNIKAHICNNCGHELTSTARYCPVCGQQATTGKVPLKTFLSELIATSLNLDSSLFRTLSHLFIPAYLTKEFFKGKHVSYYRPLRLFFVTLVLLYAVLGSRYFSKIDLGIEADTERQAYFSQKYLDAKLPEAKAKIRYDSLSAKERALIDSLTQSLRNEDESNFNINFGMTNASFSFPMSDLYELEVDSIVKKNQIEGFLGKLATHQLIRVRKDPEGAIQSFIANTTWMILLIMPVLALIMKLLYIRRNKFYVEHLVFLFHYHAAVFVCMSVYFLLINHLPKSVIIAVPILCLIFLLFGMKSYYHQGWIKTILKYMTLSFAYLILLLLFTLLTVTVSFFVL